MDNYEFMPTGDEDKKKKKPQIVGEIGDDNTLKILPQPEVVGELQEPITAPQKRAKYLAAPSAPQQPQEVTMEDLLNKRNEIQSAYATGKPSKAIQAQAAQFDALREQSRQSALDDTKTDQNGQPILSKYSQYKQQYGIEPTEGLIGTSRITSNVGTEGVNTSTVQASPEGQLSNKYLVNLDKHASEKGDVLRRGVVGDYAKALGASDDEVTSVLDANVKLLDSPEGLWVNQGNQKPINDIDELLLTGNYIPTESGNLGEYQDNDLRVGKLVQFAKLHKQLYPNESVNVDRLVSWYDAKTKVDVKTQEELDKWKAASSDNTNTFQPALDVLQNMFGVSGGEDTQHDTTRKLESFLDSESIAKLNQTKAPSPSGIENPEVVKIADSINGLDRYSKNVQIQHQFEKMKEEPATLLTTMSLINPLVSEGLKKVGVDVSKYIPNSRRLLESGANLAPFFASMLVGIYTSLVQAKNQMADMPVKDRNDALIKQGIILSSLPILGKGAGMLPKYGSTIGTAAQASVFGGDIVYETLKNSDQFKTNGDWDIAKITSKLGFDLALLGSMGSHSHPIKEFKYEVDPEPTRALNLTIIDEATGKPAMLVEHPVNHQYYWREISDAQYSKLLDISQKEGRPMLSQKIPTELWKLQTTENGSPTVKENWNIFTGKQKYTEGTKFLTESLGKENPHQMSTKAGVVMGEEGEAVPAKSNKFLETKLTELPDTSVEDRVFPALRTLSEYQDNVNIHTAKIVGDPKTLDTLKYLQEKGLIDIDANGQVITDKYTHQQFDTFQKTVDDMTLRIFDTREKYGEKEQLDTEAIKKDKEKNSEIDKPYTKEKYTLDQIAKMNGNKRDALALNVLNGNGLYDHATGTFLGKEFIENNQPKIATEPKLTKGTPAPKQDIGVKESNFDFKSLGKEESIGLPDKVVLKNSENGDIHILTKEGKLYKGKGFRPQTIKSVEAKLKEGSYLYGTDKTQPPQQHRVTEDIHAQNELHYDARQGDIQITPIFKVDASDKKWNPSSGMDFETDGEHVIFNQPMIDAYSYIGGADDKSVGLTHTTDWFKRATNKLLRDYRDIIDKEDIAGLEKFRNYLNTSDNFSQTIVGLNPTRNKYDTFRDTIAHEKTHSTVMNDLKSQFLPNEVTDILNTEHGKIVKDAYLKDLPILENYPEHIVNNNVAHEVLGYGTSKDSLRGLGIQTPEQVEAFKKTYIDALKAIQGHLGEDAYKKVLELGDKRLQENEEKDVSVPAGLQSKDIIKGLGDTGETGGTGVNEAPRQEVWQGSGVKEIQAVRYTPTGKFDDYTGYSAQETSIREGKKTFNFFVAKPDGTFVIEPRFENSLLKPYNFSGKLNLLDIGIDPQATKDYHDMTWEQFQGKYEKDYHGFFSSREDLPDAYKYRMSVFDNPDTRAILSGDQQVLAMRARERAEEPEFKMWATLDGYKPILDEDGKPMVLYHGTSRARWQDYGNEEDIKTKGFDSFINKGYRPFTSLGSDPKIANTFSESYSYGYSDFTNHNTVYPLFARYKKLFDYRNEKHLNELFDAIGSKNDYGEGSEIGFYNKYSFSAGNWSAIEQEEVLNWLKDNGYDGFTTEEDGVHYHIFDPKNIKSVFSKEFDDLYQPDKIYAMRAKTSEAGFYSPAEEAFLQADEKGKLPKIASGKDWYNKIKGLTYDDNGVRQGIKQSELEWMGLDTFIEGKDKLSKEEISKFIKENNVRVEQSVAGGIGTSKKLEVKWFKSKTASNITQGDNFRIIKEDGQYVIDHTLTDTTVHSSSTLDNAKKWIEDNGYKVNQQAELDRLNFEYTKAQDAVQQKRNELIAGNQDSLLSPAMFDKWKETKEYKDFQKIGDERDKLLSERGTKEPQWTSHTLGGEKSNHVEIALYVPNLEKGYTEHGEAQHPSTLYVSPHDFPDNTIVHIRGNERKIVSGEKVFHVDEWQSDLHQAGKKEGYKQGDKYVDSRNFNEDTGDYVNYQPEIPDAPFKDTGWLELGFKKALRYAVENGYNKMTWTTGKQQIDRNEYGLRFNVKKIDYRPVETKDIESGNTGYAAEGYVTKFDVDNKHVLLNITDSKGVQRKITVSTTGKTKINGNQTTLDGLVGKKVADEIREKGTGTLEGEGLSIGGRLHKFVYDEFMPRYAAKFGKKFGAEVGKEQTKIINTEYDVHKIPKIGFGIYSNGHLLVAKDTYTKAKQYADELTNKTIEEVHSIDITPKMKESVDLGMPLFARSKSSEPSEIRQDRLMRDYYSTPPDRATVRGTTNIVKQGNFSNISAPPEDLPKLTKELKDYGLKVLSAKGVYKGNPEDSLLVYYPDEVSNRVVQYLGDKYGEESVLHGVGGKYWLEFQDGSRVETKDISFDSKGKDGTFVDLSDGKLNYNTDFSNSEEVPAPQNYNLDIAKNKLENKKNGIPSPEELNSIESLNTPNGTVTKYDVLNKDGTKVGMSQVDDYGREYVDIDGEKIILKGSQYHKAPFSTEGIATNEFMKKMGSKDEPSMVQSMRKLEESGNDLSDVYSQITSEDKSKWRNSEAIHTIDSDGNAYFMRSKEGDEKKNFDIDMSDELLVSGDFEAWIDVANRLLGDSALSKSEISEIQRLSDKGDTDGLQKFVLRLNKQTVAQLVANILRVNPLVGVKNIARNTTSNTLMQVMAELSRTPAFLVDIGLAKLSEDKGRTLLAPSVIDFAKGAAKGITTGIPDAFNVFRHGSPDSTFENPSFFRDRTTGYWYLKLFELYTKYGFRLQEAADRPFKAMAYFRSLEEQIKLTAKSQKISYDEAKNELTMEDYDKAYEKALFLTFQNNNRIADEYYKYRERLAPLAQAAVDTQIKYVKTPLNVVDRTLDYTGFFPLLKLANRNFKHKDWEGFKKVVKDTLNTPEDRETISYAIGNGMVGWGLAYIGYSLGSKGYMTAFYNRDDSKERELLGARGMSYGSVQIGEHNFDISSITPVAFLMLSGAAYANEHNKYKEALAKAEQEGDEAKIKKLINSSPTGASILKMTKALALQTPFVNTAINDYEHSYSTTALVNTMIGANAVVPQIVGEIAKTKDRKERVIENTTIGSNLKDTVKSMIPYVRETLPAKYDMLGREMEAPYGLDPLKTEKIIQDPLLKEMDKYNIVISTPKEGETAVEKNAAKGEKGKYFEPILRQVIENLDYSNTPENQRGNTLQDVIKYMSPEYKKDKLKPEEENHNINVIVNRNQFTNAITTAPQQFSKDRVITDKEMLKDAAKIGIKQLDISKMYADLKNYHGDSGDKGIADFIKTQFTHQLMVGKNTTLSEAAKNFEEYKKDPEMFLIKSYLNQKEYEERQPRLKAKREELIKQGKTEKEINAIMAKDRVKIRKRNADNKVNNLSIKGL